LQRSSFRISQNGFIDHAGFHTNDLDEKAVLMEGDSFFVYLYVDKGGQPYDRTSEIPILLDIPPLYRQTISALTTVPSTAAPNESIFNIGGTWIDLQTVNITANFCIKALVKKGKFSLQQPAPETSDLISIHPNPANKRVIVDYELIQTAGVELILYDITGRVVRTLCNKQQAAGYRWEVFDVSDLPGGIYICILKVDGVKIDSQKILVIK